MYGSNKTCFACLTDNKDIAFHNVKIENEIFTQVIYALPELTILHPENPIQICFLCYSNLRCFNTFKKKCLENYNRLNNQYIKQKQEGNDYLQTNKNNDEELINQKCEISLNIEKNELYQGEAFTIKLNNADGNEDIWQPSQHQVVLKTVAINDINVKFELNSEQDLELNSFKLYIAEKVPDAWLSSQDQDNLKTVVNNTDFRDELDAKQELELNIKEENEDAWQPLDDLKTILHHTIEIKEESLASEGSSDQELDQQPIQYESVSKVEEDNDSNDVLDKKETYFNNRKDSQKFQCPLCNEVISDKLTFSNHAHIHIKSLQDLECPVCNYKFIRNRNMTLHFDIKEFECTICSQKFRRNSDLNDHMLHHIDVENFECAVCNKKCMKKCHLDRHIQIHVGIRNLECGICKQKFIRKGNWRKHKNRHLSVDDYKCSICNKKYMYKYALFRNMKVHEDKNKQKYITIKNLLSSHIKKTHQN